MAETLVLALIAALTYAVLVYNRLVRDRNRVLTAWSDIDVQLKRRHDLLPKLVAAVRRYAAYESATLEAVTQLRARSDQSPGVAEIGALESSLGMGIHRLLALVERYPELEADNAFLDLQRNISEVEDHIQYARRYYNGAVRALNTRIESFPDMLLAQPLRFVQAEYFELDDATRVQPAETL